jgi:adapter protein MecA 1/2
MRVERLNKDKVKIFMSYEDLKERGVAKDDIWSDAPEVHDLLNDMMDEVYDELGFEVFGAVAIEVYALPTQGVIVIITRGDDISKENHAIYQVDVKIGPKNFIAFSFSDFEDLVNVVKNVRNYVAESGSVYHYNNHYILLLNENEFKIDDYDSITAILSEFGSISSLTKEYLFEYAKPIIKGDAIKVLTEYF